MDCEAVADRWDLARQVLNHRANMAGSIEDLDKFHGAIDDALEAGNASGLLTLLKSAEGKDVLLTRHRNGYAAAKHGHTECLRVLDMCGFKLPHWTWEMAAKYGHIDCLAFALSRGYTLDDLTLDTAIGYDRLACVDFLIRQGLPRKPYTYRGGRVGPGLMKALQLMADKGMHIDPSSMQAAVESGNLDFVRWLHQHEVPLWKHAIMDKHPTLQTGAERILADKPETLIIPSQPQWVEGIWKALRYGAVHGAPVISTVKKVFSTKRQQSRAVLMCLKVVERQSKATLPSPLVEEILILADLEIRESMLPPRRRRRCRRRR